MRLPAMSMQMLLRLGVLVAIMALIGLTSDAAPLPSRVLTFVDGHTGMSFTIQVEPLARDAGHFVLRVPQQGFFEGVAGQAMRVESPTSVIVHYQGNATLGPTLGVDGRPTGSVSTTSVVPVTLQAQVDPAHLTAEATLNSASTRAHLVASAIPPGEAVKVFKNFENAMLTENWGALYTLMNTDVQFASTSASFVTTLTSQAAIAGRVTRLSQVSVSPLQASDLGGVYLVGTYEMAVTSPAGVTKVMHSDVFLVRQLDSWRVWYTREY